MRKKMNIVGIGDKAGLPTLLFLGLAYWLTLKYPSIFSYPDWSLIQSIRVPKGIVLLVVGSVIAVLAGGHLVYAYSKGKLAKTGLYKIVPNPVYANGVIFLIPAFSLLANSWLMLLGSVVLYLLYRRYVGEEYKYLKEKFGKEYEDYYNSVLIKWL